MWSFILVLYCLIPFVSCNHEDLEVYVESEHYRNAADFTANNYELTLFHAALETAGLLDTLRGAGPFTVFAPSNQAFNDLGIVRASDFSQMDRDSLRFMLLYHILPQRLYSSDISENSIDNPHVNLAGKELLLSRKLNTLCPSCANASFLGVNGTTSMNTTFNVVLANGVLHLTNKVMKYKEGTVQRTLESQPEFSLFVQMLKHFGEWDRLSDSGPLTVMAPANTAFEKRGITSLNIQEMDTSAFYKEMLLRPYVLNNHIFSSDLDIYGYSNAGNLGESYLNMPVDGAPAYVSGIARFIVDGSFSTGAFVSEKDPPAINQGYRRNATFSNAWQLDYKADNGIVHAINDLLVYPEDAIK